MFIARCQLYADLSLGPAKCFPHSSNFRFSFDPGVGFIFKHFSVRVMVMFDPNIVMCYDVVTGFVQTSERAMSL